MVKFKFLRDDEIAFQAQKLREEAFSNNPSYPLDLEYLVFEFLNTRHELAFYDDEILDTDDGSRVLGMMNPYKNAIHICASLKEENAGRYRFTVAHELGHWVLHRHLFNAQQDELFERQIMLTLERNLENYDKGIPNEEWQANSFAAWFLIGKEALRSRLEKRYGSLPIERIGKLEYEAWAIAVDTQFGPPLWELFGVSKTAMKWALINRKLVAEPLPLFG